MLGSLLMVFFSTGILFADTVYLKNGRNMEGIVKKQTAQDIELEVGFGVVTFQSKEILRIEKSNPQQTQRIMDKWQEQHKQVEEVAQTQKEAPVVSKQPKDLKTIVSPLDGPHILLKALLNWSITVPLMLDTGASLVVLPKEVGDKLNIDTQQPKTVVFLQIGDGSKVKAAYTVLKSINIQGVEVRDIDAAVLLDDKGKFENASGVLGMSFLNHFNIKTDRKEKKFILEKIGD